MRAYDGAMMSCQKLRRVAAHPPPSSALALPSRFRSARADQILRRSSRVVKVACGSSVGAGAVSAPVDLDPGLILSRFLFDCLPGV